MKKLGILAFLMLSMNIGYSHDEGHGPKMRKNCGKSKKSTAVISLSEANHGHHAKLLYIAGLIYNTRKSKDLKLYFCDSSFNLVTDLKKFGESIKASHMVRKGKKDIELKLDASGKFFIGKLPNKRTPFTLELNFVENGKYLFAAFDKID
jgi:hypothetical protein